jgi:hypothetical protein
VPGGLEMYRVFRGGRGPGIRHSTQDGEVNSKADTYDSAGRMGFGVHEFVKFERVPEQVTSRNPRGFNPGG